ncbi:MULTISPECIES: YhbD family protein [Clostridium]|uniref:DUF4004 domain-containing protein n=1 Tax=Clostridium cadaveris TaxID=1529 RepID=A0A1I2L258_9CLOT|nr:YhbD family protein [Clostridium cadaveris]MDU4951615.1 YhbD family protein [Clostridium sp.]MDM8311588.1 YhbD family protein [Clostridium cadaveris]MDY4950050.1 YhbD family protein [Clostridium cadaveris]NME63551.1 YhbD family protein [Clostridium cadaveris]NWK09824.1 YhbD family protein [Clostridium cadaveris]
MEENLISKKELLEKTGISYGQLYRWKRKNIIPEEWFIKKSSFTGQETYFPEDKILERIEKIKAMKDELSLEELANMFSPKPTSVNLSKEEVLEKGILSQNAINIYEDMGKVIENFESILQVYIMENLLMTGEITLDEGKALLSILVKENENINGVNYNILLVRKLGISIWMVGEFSENVFIEPQGKIVIKKAIGDFVEELKVKLNK